MRVAQRLGICGAVVLGCLLIGRGLVDTFFFEPTGEALATARGGHLRIAAGSLVVLAAAGAARTWGGGRVVLLVAAPALCGVLDVATGQTLLAQIVAVPAFTAGLGGAVGFALRPPDVTRPR